MQKEMTDCYLAMGYFKVATGVDLGKFTLDCQGEHAALMTLIVSAMEKDKKVREALIDAVDFYKKKRK